MQSGRVLVPFQAVSLDRLEKSWIIGDCHLLGSKLVGLPDRSSLLVTGISLGFLTKVLLGVLGSSP